MGREYNPISNRKAVLSYYRRAETGYWDDLGGVCHYGFSHEDDEGSFNMPSAQIEMERLLGNTLGLPPDSKVLDAGCGYCPLSRRLTEEFGFDVTGIDLISNRLDQGSRINRDADLQHTLDLVNADYHRLPFANASFDGVCTMETLVHANDHKLVLSEFLRVLRPGGRIVLFEYSIPELHSVPALARLLAERVIRDTGMSSLPNFTHGSFPKILEQAGFENAESEDISKKVYPSWFHLWKLAGKTTLAQFGQGRVSFDSIPGSLWIWPARHRLGYNICQANRPLGQ